MPQKNNSARITDQHNINKVMKNVNIQESEMYNGRVGTNEELQLVGIGDASFKTDVKSVRGMIMLLIKKPSEENKADKESMLLIKG